MEKESYGGRIIYKFPNTPGLDGQIIGLACYKDSILVFGDLENLSPRIIIDAAKVNTEASGIIVIRKDGNQIRISVRKNTDGTGRDLSERIILSQEVAQYQQDLAERVAKIQS